MPRISRQLASFKAEDPSGNVHTVFARQTFTVVYGGRRLREAPGPILLNLADGTAVNRRRKGEYEITLGRVPLTSNDPAAP